MALMGCGRLAACKILAGKKVWCGRHRPMRVNPGDLLAHVGHRPTSAEIRVDVRARQARRKALKPLLSELFPASAAQNFSFATATCFSPSASAAQNFSFAAACSSGESR